MSLRALSLVWICWLLLGTNSAVAANEAHQYTDAELQQLMVDGRKLVEQGKPKAAIDEMFDPVINYFKQVYSDPGQQVFAATTQEEALFYAALGATLNKTVVVVNSLWSDAYLMKGYASTDLGQIAQAREALEAAIALAPQNPRYLSEMGYWHQVNRDWESSLSSYESAADAAELISDKAMRVEELTRALRGQGYALVEMQKFDEAEALYEKCLKLNRKDDKARGELAYIKQARRAKKQ